MKFKAKITVLLAPILFGMVAASEVDWNKWLNERKNDMAIALELPKQERIPALGRLVIASGPGEYDASSATADGIKREFLSRVQPELISIPGHAKHYDKRIRDAYADFRDPASPRHSGSANSLQREMQWGFETLRNLPSPETVKVLGDMLAEEWQHSVEPGDEYVPPSLATASVHALAVLPLRETPTPPFYWHLSKERLPVWQEWYAEVKSGQRSFSFKGQAVEYRFKSDGTWETIPISNPPDDDPAISEAPAKEKPASRPPPAQEVEYPKPVGNSWTWIVGAVIAALGGLVWFGARMFKGNG